jgi:antagonist of SinR
MYFGSDKMVIIKNDVEVIDQEWMELILEARDMGLSINVVREFLSQQEVMS